MFTMKCEVLNVSNKISKAGKPYNLVTLGLPGYQRMSLFLAEQLVPDFIEGKMLEIQFAISIKNFRPDLRITGVVK